MTVSAMLTGQEVWSPIKFNLEDPMGGVYAFAFCSLLVITALLSWQVRPQGGEELSLESRQLKRCYLVVWYLCVAADWLHGPYVYALYQAYGYDRKQISQLFVAGFGTAMIVGPFAGSLADRIGRKRSCQAFCLFYIASCITKHFALYWVLMLGRVFGGIATSLLFSGFEAWLVAESRCRENIGQDALGHIFAMMWFGSSLIAIVAGIMGDVIVGTVTLQRIAGSSYVYYGGVSSPFDFAIVLLVVAFACISALWPENYGAASTGDRNSVWLQLKEGASIISGSNKLLAVLLVVAGFEGSMYAFVFNWTPALESDFTKPAFGMIFATFMMAYMCGASTFDLARRRGVESVRTGHTACILGVWSFFVACAARSQSVNRLSLTCAFMAFVCFEFCCGLYFPSISSLKGELVPEAVRSTVYSLCRVPMNAIVLTVLLANVTMTAVFAVCFALLLIASHAITNLGSITVEGPPQMQQGKQQSQKVRTYGTP